MILPNCDMAGSERHLPDGWMSRKLMMLGIWADTDLQTASRGRPAGSVGRKFEGLKRIARTHSKIFVCTTTNNHIFFLSFVRFSDFT